MTRSPSLGSRADRPPAGQIDAGQHNFVEALVHQPLDLVDHNARRDRPRIAATVRDDAKGAAVIAAVLDLHIGAARVPKPSIRCPAVSVTDMMSST